MAEYWLYRLGLVGPQSAWPLQLPALPLRKINQASSTIGTGLSWVGVAGFEPAIAVGTALIRANGSARAADSDLVAAGR
jgi:hypothetical protein